MRFFSSFLCIALATGSAQAQEVCPYRDQIVQGAWRVLDARPEHAGLSVRPGL